MNSFFQNARISTNPTQYHLILLMEEILRSPVEVGSLSHYLQGFRHPRWFFPAFFGSQQNGVSEVNLPYDQGLPTIAFTQGLGVG